MEALGSGVVDIDHNDDQKTISRAEQGVVDERSLLLPPDGGPSPSLPRADGGEPGDQLSSPERRPKNFAGIIGFLLIGVFIASVDGFFVLATSGTISSSFSQLEYASWLITSYGLAMGAAQPVIGKLSDILGRKAVLLACYALFGVGITLCGIGQELWHVIAGRAVSGLGGAGIVVMYSILIADFVPKLEIATWRSYVNVVVTVGKGLGGPLGGWVTDTVGWRWSFLGQVPFIALGFLVVSWGLENYTQTPIRLLNSSNGAAPSKLGRIDFFGAALISATVVSFLLSVDLPGQGVSWTSPLVMVLITTSIILGTIFLIFEGLYAHEPIFPPRLLLLRDVVTTYSIITLQAAAQTAMMFSVPLYFQVTEGASNTRAGSHLIPATVGNMAGGLLTGYIIKRTGRYKFLITLAATSAVASYCLLILRWHGQITILDSLEIFPAGFGTGMMAATAFIALTSNIAHADMAVATSGYYLAGNIGSMLGICGSSSLQRWILKKLLVERITVPNSGEIIEYVLSDVLYIKHLSSSLRYVVINSYVESLEYSHGFSLICSALTFLISLVVKERTLTG